MKHLFIIALLPALAHAQSPTLTRTNFYTPGDKFLRVAKIDTGLNAITIDTGGATITWDFSAVDFAHPSVMVDTLSCVLPDTTPFFNAPTVNYDTSNLCLRLDTDPFSPEDNAYTYYLADNNALQYVGSWANNGGAERTEYRFTNLRTDLVFPLTFSQTFTDSFQSSYNDQSGSGYHFQNGLLTLTVDGYGTLIMSDGDTIENTLRLKEEITLTDSSDLFGTNAFSFLTYYWYAADRKGPVLQLNMDAGTPGVVMIAYYFKNLMPTSTGYIDAALPQMHIYPNPATGMFTVSIRDARAKGCSLSLFNAAGKLLQKEPLTTTAATLNTGNLPAGMYLVELRDGNGNKVSKKVWVD